MSEMNLYDAMSTLRAVRRLRPDPIPEDSLQRILQAATWAPTGGNVQPWRMIAVRDPAKKQAMQPWYAGEWNKYTVHYRERIAHLPANEKAKMERTLDAGDHLASNFGQTPVILVFCFNPNIMTITDIDQDRTSVVGGGSVYPAVENALLACRAEGLGCVLTTLLCYREPDVKALLDIPDDWGTCAAVPIGYAVGKGHGPISRRPIDKMAFEDSWGNAFQPKS
ncbi:MAG: nitroreductase family protein [Pseudomonadota bacterium]